MELQAEKKEMGRSPTWKFILCTHNFGIRNDAERFIICFLYLRIYVRYTTSLESRIHSQKEEPLTAIFLTHCTIKKMNVKQQLITNSCGQGFF